MGECARMPDRPRVKSLLIAMAVAAVVGISGTSRLTAALGDTRTLSLFNIHTKETTSVLYKKDGKWVPGAKDKLDWALRDWRRDEKTAMDPELMDLLWDIHTELGSREPIHIISAYRSRGTNDMLRKTVGGQASESRHILGQAIDVHFPDVPLVKLRYSALIRERGGVGYYPTSALPFVHIDTDRVRHWPRLPRMELALLFPNGRTQHQPADGGPITTDDVRTAQGRHQELATTVAAFHDFRRQPKLPVAVADAAAVGPQAPAARQVASAQPANLPQLIEAPRVIDRPSRLTGPTTAERQKLAELMQLAAAAPEPRLVQGPQPARRTPPAQLPSLTGAQMAPPVGPQKPAARVAAADPADRLSDTGRGAWGNGFAVQPAFDDEHPEELSYRPFPIAPFMTASASPDDPAFAKLEHPDVARTLDMLDQAGSAPPMRLRPARQAAALMLAQQFRGEAVSFATFRDTDADAVSVGSGVASRKVSTTGR